MSDESALEQLKELLKVNSDLLNEQLKANELKNIELELRRKELEQEQAKIDLDRVNKALRKEALNRAETRLQEVLQRYAGLSDRVEILISYTQKLLFDDDAFKDILSSLSERFELFERAMMLALMDRLDSPHIQNETAGTIEKLNETLSKASKRRQLASHYKTLNRLEEKVAKGEDGVADLNRIDEIKEIIATLEESLNG